MLFIDRTARRPKFFTFTVEIICNILVKSHYIFIKYPIDAEIYRGYIAIAWFHIASKINRTTIVLRRTAEEQYAIDESSHNHTLCKQVEIPSGIMIRLEVANYSREIE